MKSPFATTVARLLLAAALALLVPLAKAKPVVTDSSKGNVAETAPAQTAPDDFRPGEVLVRFEDGLPAARLTSALAAQGLRVKRHIPRFGIYVLTVPEGRELSTVAALRSDPRVEYAGLNYRVYAPEPRATSLPQMTGLAASAAGPVIPDDPLFFPWQQRSSPYWSTPGRSSPDPICNAPMRPSVPRPSPPGACSPAGR